MRYNMMPLARVRLGVGAGLQPSLASLTRSLCVAHKPYDHARWPWAWPRFTTEPGLALGFSISKGQPGLYPVTVSFLEGSKIGERGCSHHTWKRDPLQTYTSRGPFSQNVFLVDKEQLCERAFSLPTRSMCSGGSCSLLPVNKHEDGWW